MIRAIKLPPAFYLPRRTIGGGEVRDIMPIEGADAYVTDGERYGVQYPPLYVVEYLDGDTWVLAEPGKRPQSEDACREDIEAYTESDRADGIEREHRITLVEPARVDWLGSDPVSAYGEGAEVIED